MIPLDPNTDAKMDPLVASKPVSVGTPNGN